MLSLGDESLGDEIASSSSEGEGEEDEEAGETGATARRSMSKRGRR
jgi:hypothetical protein